MKRRIVHLIGVVLLLSLLFVGCNDLAETQPNTPEETPVNTPIETPEETPVETPAETPEPPSFGPEFDSPTKNDPVVDESTLPFDVRSAMLYYGNFNGIYVVDIYQEIVIGVEPEVVGGYKFEYRDSPIDVYDAVNKKYYSLIEAYHYNILTIDHIRYIYEKYTEIYPKPDDEMPKATVGEDGFYYIDGVCTGIKAGVSDTVTDRYWAKTDAVSVGLLASFQVETPAETPEAPTEEIPKETPEEIPAETPSDTPLVLPSETEPEFDLSTLPRKVKSAMMFFGEFNGVFVINYYEDCQLCIPYTESVAGFDFFAAYAEYDPLNVYNSNDGKYYTLGEAYRKGLLTVDNLKVVYEKVVKWCPLAYDLDQRDPEITLGENGYYYFDGEFSGIKAGVTDDKRESAITYALVRGILKSRP